MSADKFELVVELGNDAMRTPSDVARLLRQVAKQVEALQRFGKVNSSYLRDDNGNTVGFWKKGDG